MLSNNFLVSSCNSIPYKLFLQRIRFPPWIISWILRLVSVVHLLILLLRRSLLLHRLHLPLGLVWELLNIFYPKEIRRIFLVWVSSKSYVKGINLLFNSKEFGLCSIVGASGSVYSLLFSSRGLVQIFLESFWADMIRIRGVSSPECSFIPLKSII